MSKIYVLSKRKFDAVMDAKGINDSTVSKFKATFMISISDPKKGQSCKMAISNQCYFKKDHPNVLRLCFSDTENPANATPDNGIVIFSDNDANNIIHFLDHITTSGVEDFTLLVHCAAGVSRSAAVGTFASDYMGLDYKEFMKLNRYLAPNSLVIRTLKRHTI